jgi:hypothetical protein
MLRYKIPSQDIRYRDGKIIHPYNVMNIQAVSQCTETLAYLRHTIVKYVSV